MRRGIAAAYAWTSPRVRALSVAVYRTTAKSLSFVGAKSDAFARASLRQASTGLTWLGTKTKILATSTFKATSVGSAWFAAKTKTATLASAKRASNASSWLGAKTKAASLASLEATSSGLAWIGEKSRDAAVIAGQQSRRGAAGLKRSALATKEWAVSRRASPGNAEPSSEFTAEARESAEPQVEAGDVVPQDSDVPQGTPPTSARRSRAKSRTIRASRPALRQSPRVAGRWPVRR
jgi:hypothetical protein